MTNDNVYTAMIEALQAAGISNDTEATEYGWSETQAWEPITEIDFDAWVEMTRNMQCSQDDYFRDLCCAFEDRLDRYTERSERSKEGHKRRKVTKHLKAKAETGLKAAKTISLF